MNGFRLEIRHEVQVDLVEAMDWHEDQLPGLGIDLRDEIDRTIARIGDGPLQFPVVFQSCRRAITDRFSYAIYFRINPERTIRVLAIRHTSRDMKALKRRLK